MNYIFYGFYWAFCVIRAIFTNSFGEPEYGAFKDPDGLAWGLIGTLIWCVVVYVIGYLIDAFEGWREQEKK